MRRDEATARREAEQGYGEAGERELRQREWATLRGERGEPAPNPQAFERLVWRLQAREYWKAKNPESRARILAYRKQWALDHAEQYRKAVNAAKRRRRARPEIHAAEIAERRAKRAAETTARKSATTYTCAQCGATWKPGAGRLPAIPPKYCSQPCRSRANYLRGKAAGKPWALRDKAHRSDRGAAA